MNVLVVNTGSSSLKVAAVVVERGGVRVVEREERGVEGGVEGALRECLEGVGAWGWGVAAIGHRVVHPGSLEGVAERVSLAVERAIEEGVRVAPQHNRRALEAIRRVRTWWPEVPAVAVFDTEFHAGRAAESMRYALPWDMAQGAGFVRRGYHGIAHAALVDAVAEAEGRGADTVDAVTLQLGSGCSACAVRGGRSIETSMGFSPLEGLPMRTRAGDVDPAVVLELVAQGRSAAEVRELLSRRSGFFGMTGEADLRRVLAGEAAGDERCGVAVRMLVRRITMVAGAYFTLLEGRGALVFGGGIGARSAEIRRRVAEGLSAWNVRLDPERNEAGGPGAIAAEGARPAYVFETDEERSIARRVAEVLGAT